MRRSVVYAAMESALASVRTEADRTAFKLSHGIKHRTAGLVQRHGDETGVAYRAFFYHLMRMWQPSSFVEHGTGSGWSTRWAAIGSPKTKIITIDAKDNPCGSVLDPCANVTRFIGDVLDPWILETTMSELDKKIDVLFVDAAHDAKGVQKEYEMWVPSVWRPGLVCFDDVNCPSSLPTLKLWWDKMVLTTNGTENANELHPHTGFGLMFVGEWE